MPSVRGFPPPPRSQSAVSCGVLQGHVGRQNRTVAGRSAGSRWEAGDDRQAAARREDAHVQE